MDDGTVRCPPPPSRLCRRPSAFSPSSNQSLSPPLTFPELLRLLRTFPVSPRTGPQARLFLSDLSLPSCVRTPGFGAIRPATPAPHLGRAGLLRDRRDTRSSDRLYSAHCPGPWIYIWLAPPPPACPKKLLESWKRFRRAPWLGEEKKKKPKTSPKPPWLPPLCLRALSQPLGPTAPSSY